MDKFYVIFAVPLHLDDFVVIAILSNGEDADKLISQTKESGRFRAVASPQHLEMSVILEFLVKDRLMQLHEPLMRIVKSLDLLEVHPTVQKLLDIESRLAGRKTILDPEGVKK
jgi:uncharacterized protein with PIN domain